MAHLLRPFYASYELPRRSGMRGTKGMHIPPGGDVTQLPNFYRELLERSLDIVTILDTEGRIVYESPAFEHLFGYAPAELIGQPVLTFVHEDDQAATVAAISGVYSGKESDSVVVRFRHRDGFWRWIEAAGRVLELDGQTLLLVNSRDVTDKQQIMHRLSATNELLSKTLDSSRNLVSITRADTGEYIEVNRQWLLTAGYERDEVVGRTANELGIWGSPENRDRVMQAIAAAGGSLRDFEVVTYARRGPRELIINVETFELDGERLILMTGSDETDRRIVEEQLRQAQKMEAVGQLTGGVAHDFNNLLGIILGHAELLREAAENGEDLAPLIEPILQAADRGATLTQQLLAFSRRQLLAPRPVDLDTVVARMQPLLQSTLTPAIRLTVEVPDDLWTCQVDPGQLENALLNLVLNARDAVDGDGSICVRLANSSLGDDPAMIPELRKGDYVTIAISDDGPGMDQATIDRVFEPFFTTKPPGRGTGLGLSMVFGFVRQSDGQVVIDSTPGVGTTVTLWLPRAQVDEQEAGIRQVTRLEARSGETILVLEDEAELLNVVRLMLEDLGYRVLPATDAEQALSLAEHEGRVDLMLSDIVLAGTRRGPDVARTLRTTQPGLPVLYMSGFPATEADDGDLPGAVGPILTKPFTRAVLGRRVREAFDGQRASA